jgi:acetoin utilization deacetylase AcuC-like enzyme
VVDVDYHAGDGTAQILGPSKMVSLHCAEDYPYRSPEEPWAIALPKQTSWAQYEPRLREALARRPPTCGALRDPPHCRPSRLLSTTALPDCFTLLSTDVLVVSLGLDALAGDPDSRHGHGFALTVEDYGSMGALIRSAGLQTLVLQEGGYDLGRVPKAVRAFISALGGGGTKL